MSSNFNTMVSSEQFNNIISWFFSLKTTNKLYHWNTNYFSRHKATDEFNNKIEDLIDRFVEVFIGTYKIKPIINKIKIEDQYLSDNGIVELFELTKKFLISFDNMINDTSLLNIRDEMLAEVNKTLYLFTLK